MNTMERQIPHGAEMKPQGFFEKIKEKAQQALLEMKENLSQMKDAALEMPEPMKTLREGNFSDNLRAELRVKADVAEKLFEQLPKGIELSKEEYHNRQHLAKIVEFYKDQEKFFAWIAETKDDPDLNELALIMWSELQETYAKCMNEFTRDSSKE